MSEYDHEPCCGPNCQGVACTDCLGTGHPHASSEKRGELHFWDSSNPCPCGDPANCPATPTEQAEVLDQMLGETLRADWESWIHEIRTSLKRLSHVPPWRLSMVQPDMAGRHQYVLHNETSGPEKAVIGGTFRALTGDAQFIEKAPEYVMVLLNALEAAQTAVRALGKERNEWARTLADLRDEKDAEIERLEKSHLNSMDAANTAESALVRLELAMEKVIADLEAYDCTERPTPQGIDVPDDYESGIHKAALTMKVALRKAMGDE